MSFFEMWESAVLQQMRSTINPPMLLNPETGEVTPLVPGGITKVNVRENAVAMLGQVQSHLANIEGQLASTKAQLNIRTKELAQEKGLRQSMMKREERALYVNRDGSTKVTSVAAEPDPSRHNECRPARTVNVAEMGPMPLALDYHDVPPSYTKPTYRTYRLMFSQPSLHVYQEV
jgi:hypothetical protein